MASSSETVKNAIINEIEENITFVSNQKSKVPQEEILAFKNDRDNYTSSENLLATIYRGVDPRFVEPESKVQALKSNVTVGTSETVEISAVLEEQLEIFLSRLESVDIDDLSGGYLNDAEDLDLSLKERVQNISLPKHIFDTLLLPMRTSRPALSTALQQHTIISGQQRARNKKTTKRDKKRERERERERQKDKEKRQSLTGAGKSMLPPSAELKAQARKKKKSDPEQIPLSPSSQDVFRDAPPYDTNSRELYATLIAKTIVDGSMVSYLMSISLLFALDRHSQNQELFLPVGNVLAAAFQRETRERSESEGRVQFDFSEELMLAKDQWTLFNPLRHLLLSSRSYSSSESALKSMSFGEFARRSTPGSPLSSFNEKASVGGTDETTSQYSERFHGPFSDAGSTVGERLHGPFSDAGSTVGSAVGSTLADQGTETASNIGEHYEHEPEVEVEVEVEAEAEAEIEDEEATEEELLAQALALSMSSAKKAATGSQGAEGSQDSSDALKPPHMGGASVQPQEKFDRRLDAASLGQHSLSSLTNSAMRRKSSDGPIEYPERLQGIHALSSFGPLCRPEFWCSLKSAKPNMDADLYVNGLTSLSVRQIMVCLLSLIGNSADLHLGEEPCRFTAQTSQGDKDAFVNRKLSGSVVPAMASNATVFMLLEHLLDSFITELREHCSSDPMEQEARDSDPTSSYDTQWFNKRYFLVWAINIATKLLRANLHCVAQSKSNPASVGLGPEAPVVLPQFVLGAQQGAQQGATPTAVDARVSTVQRLLMYVADIIGLDAAIAGEHANMVNAALSTQQSLSLNSFSLKWPSEALRHELRMAGIDAYVAGLSVFLPNVSEQFELLVHLLHKAPTSSDDSLINEMKFATATYKMETLENSNNTVMHISEEIYTYTLLQRLCAANFAFSSRKSICAPEGCSLEAFLRSDANDQITSRSIDALVLGRTCGATAMCNARQIAEYFPQEAACLPNWGEYTLLRAIQRAHMRDFMESKNTSFEGPNGMLFDRLRCHQNVHVSDDQRSATFRAWGKSWASVTINGRGYAPSTGVHEWKVRIDNCDRGHVFVGVVDAEASMDTYVGGDKHGWGVIGTRSLWHNRAKIASDFGAGFSAQSVVRVKLDTSAGRLWVSSVASGGGDGDWVLAFDNIPRTTLYPAVSMHHRDDKITILCTGIPPTSAPDQDSATNAMMEQPASHVEKQTVRTKFVRLFPESCCHFLNYAKNVFYTATTFLDAAEEVLRTADEESVTVLSAHPLIAQVIPSLAAIVMRTPIGDEYKTAIASQLIPIFIVLSKRLGKILEVVSAYAKRKAGNSSNMSHGKVTGKWVFRMNSEQKVYHVKFGDQFQALQASADADCGTVEMETEEDGDDEEAPGVHEMRAQGLVPVYGQGGIASDVDKPSASAAQQVPVHGTQYGAHLVFVENREENPIKFDGRVSICRTMFEGKYVDRKAGRSGSVEGERLIDEDCVGDLSSVNLTEATLRQCASLCTSVCGKLAGTLISDTSFACKTSDMEDDSPASESHDDPDLKEEATSAETAADDAAGSSQKEITQRWIKSDLFSGGLPLNDHILQEFADEIKFLAFVPSTKMATDVNSRMKGNFDDSMSTQHDEGADATDDLISWWLDKAFPLLKDHFIAKDAEMDPDPDYMGKPKQKMMTTPDALDNIGFCPESSVEHFIHELVSGFGEAMRIDEYLLDHIGKSAMANIGGEVVSQTRRQILAALIRHSGCGCVCVSEAKAFQAGKKQLSDRPSPVLKEVWQAALRCVDYIVRLKRTSGEPFPVICGSLASKAQLLLSIEPNSVCIAVAESLSMICGEYLSRDDNRIDDDDCPGVDFWKGDSGVSLSQDCSKLLQEATNFMLSPLRSVSKLIMYLRKQALTAIYRIAGLQSIMMLYQKQDSPRGTNTLPMLSALTIQPCALEHLLAALLGRLSEPRQEDAKLGKNAEASESASGDDTSTDAQNGHYAAGLKSINRRMHSELTKAFESLYEYITQLLSRCTWAGDREGQGTALKCWGVVISIEDHLFLNRVGIFRVMQTVLDEIRTSMVQLSAIASSSSGPSDAAHGDCDALSARMRGPFAAEILMTTNKALAKLVLRVVHSLASQVAFSSDPKNTVISRTASFRLHRMPSGPDTLSQSLFDMLYSELFYGLKSIITESSKRVDETSGKATPSKRIADGEKDEDTLQGEEYIYRILRLLFFVSNSRVCQKSLSTPKWISLFLMAIGCGGLGVQRRVLRLLRRLLINIHPKFLKAYVPSFSFLREELGLAETPIDEDEIDNLIAEQASDNRALGGKLVLTSCAERIVYLFMEGVSVIFPSVQDDPMTNNSEFLHDLYSARLVQPLSGESLALLRVLQGVPEWRAVIDSVVCKTLDIGLLFMTKAMSKAESQSSKSTEADICEELHCAVAAMSINGGYVDRFRVGGLVSLKPFSLVSPSDPLSNRITGVTKSFGMLVAQNASQSTVELVLIERGIRQLKSTQPSDAEGEANSKNIQHTTSIAATIPLIAIRLNANDVSPVADIPVIPDFISAESFAKVLSAVSDISLPWAEKNLDALGNALEVPGFESSSKLGDCDVLEDYHDPDDPDEDDNVMSPKEGEEAIGDSEKSTSQQVATSSSESSKPTSEAEKTRKLTEAPMLLFHTMTFKNFVTAVSNPKLSELLLKKSGVSIVPDLLRHSVKDVSAGGLCVLEQVEERWANLWDAYYESFFDSKDAHKTSVEDSLNQASEFYRRGGSGNDGDRQGRTQDSGFGTGGGRPSPLLEAAAAAGLFAGGLSRLVDPAVQQAALAQMMDLGLPRDWCEVALRRCRYNVEMAINMCFENGADMAHIVAEEAIMREAQTMRSRGESRYYRDRDRDRERDRDSDRERGTSAGAAAGAGQGLVSLLSRSVGRREAPSQPDSSSMRQLLEMGFPPSWCTRAMEAANNNVDAALTWILAHGEDLAAEGDSTGAGDGSAGGAMETVAEEPEAPIINPLCAISGVSDISTDLKCTAPHSGFPSVGCRGFAASSGKWYYELTIHTAGCIQIGWVDTAFEGAAEAGQGVGDDRHSWAYDGWRIYTWHEACAEWGAKWVPGDVIGCAIDVDNRKMSFYLNGYGEDIDMGLAFSDFEYAGGLYPCASFNRKESIQFNFGSTAFKFGPPPGYAPFLIHMESVLRKSSKETLPFQFPATTRYLSDDSEEGGRVMSPTAEMEASTSLGCEDALEECREDNDFHWHRRYFAADEIRSTNLSLGQEKAQVGFPKASFQSFPSKSDRTQILHQLGVVSRDLMVLYARIACLRLLNSLQSGCASSAESLYKALCLCAGKRSEEDGDPAAMAVARDDDTISLDDFILILRLSTISSSRTRTYLMCTGILPSTVPIPAHLGSVYCTGGAPLLCELKSAMKHLLLAAGSQRKMILDRMLDQILLDSVNSTNRESAGNWKHEGGFVPILLRGNSIDAVQNAKACANHSSLVFAVWMTQIVMEEMRRLLGCQDVSAWQDVSGSIVKLCSHWCIALKSPNAHVKVCAAKILSHLLQENLRECGPSRDPALLRQIVECLPVHRIERLVIERTNLERGSLPVVSEYLQGITELLLAIKETQHLIDDKHMEVEGMDADIATNKSDKISDVEFDRLITDGEENDINSSYQWESIDGRMIADGDWETWTGVVKQLGVMGVPPGADRRAVERQNQPPELMPGCKVSRPYPKDSVQSPESALSPESGVSRSQSLSASEDIDDSPSLSKKLKKVLEGVASSVTTAVNKERDSSNDRIGTVEGITTWDATSPRGSARIIKWDDDGSTEKIRWGLDGIYDVSHVKVRGGKIISTFPNPMSKDCKLTNNYFDQDSNFGIILRVRHLPPPPDMSEDDEVESSPLTKLVGILEWPDFNAIVYVEGFSYEDGRWSLNERKLVKGLNHAPWTIRFGHAHWKAGTKYDLYISRDPRIDKSDPLGRVMVGSYGYTAHIGGKQYNVIGDISLQQSRLFVFDENAKATNAHLSSDKLTVAKVGGSGQAITFASVGFSSGVHFWEYKIEQAEPGTIFVGVAEKIFPPGTPASTVSARCNRWTGSGFCNHRASFRSGSSSVSDRVASYGDHFHSGDVVGVLLDMNRGKLAFFLDGLKYGEHSITDLGDAFDSLSNPGCARPRTLFPIVGLQKSQDRVTITPKWVSAIGLNAAAEMKVVSRAWRLLNAWSIERPHSSPLRPDLWIYRAGWRDWLHWQRGSHMRVRTRCRALGTHIMVDTSPTACVEASIRLGLSKALFKNDRISFSKSSGRHLGVKEEATVLGAYRGQLWYRLESQHGGNQGSSESSSLAWCLAPCDVEGMTLVRRCQADPAGVPPVVAELYLPRIPLYHGGLLMLTHDGGAVMRNGIEIDNSDVLMTIPANTTVYAIERRVNSSNIPRYRLIYSGHCGWISERMRGGGEEVMLSRITTATSQEVADGMSATMEAAAEQGVTERIIWDDVQSIEEALRLWREAVLQTGHDPAQLSSNTSGTEPSATFHEYVGMASTTNGTAQWSVEADMQLAEVISKQANRHGLMPSNLSIADLHKALDAFALEASNTAGATASLLKDISRGRIIARASILRVANLIFAWALPYMSTSLPEEKWRKDCCGAEPDIDLALQTQSGGCESKDKTSSPSDSSPANSHRLKEMKDSNNVVDINVYMKTGSDSWTPSCIGRRLRSYRRLMFNQTKIAFWDSLLDATTTPTPLHQDEYEDPREIRTLRLNRVKATHARLATLPNAQERFKQSVFGQLHKELRSWPSSAFRRSFLSKGHGGQRRAFKVKFIGEGVNDYGGPYRAAFEQVVDELQADAVVVGRKPSERCLLPLLIPCPNRAASLGSNQDKFLLSTAPSSPSMFDQMNFFGKLVGTAVRHKLTLGLDLSALVWRPLVRLQVAKAHLETIDTLVAKTIENVCTEGVKLEQQAAQDPGSKIELPDDWEDLSFSVYLPDGTRAGLIPGGEDIPVTIDNWREWVQLVERARLLDSVGLYKAFRDGLSCVLPAEVLPLFTAVEIEQLVTGNRRVDVDVLKQCTEYENLDPTSATVRYFWETLEEMTDEERTLFLRFVWARSRMPSSVDNLSMNFKLIAAQESTDCDPDTYLPHAQTCFFSLSLPTYSSKDILRMKLLYAINNSPNMDADVRLHSAEGWADS